MKKQVNKATVQKLLISLGVAPSMNGYRYLTSAILLKIARESITLCGLYSEVAKLQNTTASAVERCMRFAVMRVYNANKLEGLNDLYNANIICELPRLSDFIMYIVEYLCCFYQDDELVYLN